MTAEVKAKARLLLFIAILSLNYFEARADELVRSFAIKEFFGVSHPNQIIDFDFSGSMDWTKAYMIGPAGNEVPYQVLQGGKIAVQTDLPANAEKTWKLMSGRAPTPFAGGVKVNQTDAYYELTNRSSGNAHLALPRFMRLGFDHEDAQRCRSLRHTPGCVGKRQARGGHWYYGRQSNHSTQAD